LTAASRLRKTFWTTSTRFDHFFDIVDPIDFSNHHFPGSGEQMAKEPVKIIKDKRCGLKKSKAGY
jgi:hypothetical protein